MKQILITLTFIACVIFICFNSSMIIDSCSSGLYLWYNQLVPVILPFLLLSGCFMSLLDFDNLKISQAMFMLIICGLMCGYPIGAIVINKLYMKHVISKDTAYAIMPLCNNVSPMFLIGYIYNTYLRDYMSIPQLLMVIYTPQIIYAIIYIIVAYATSNTKETDSLKEPQTDSSQNNQSFIENSIQTIAIIGIYIVIFSILYDLVMHYNVNDIASIHITACFLEITSGIPELNNYINDIHIRTALILALTSFGGLSSILQCMHILRESRLALYKYISGKVICSIISCVLVLLL